MKFFSKVMISFYETKKYEKVYQKIYKNTLTQPQQNGIHASGKKTIKITQADIKTHRSTSDWTRVFICA